MIIIDPPVSQFSPVPAIEEWILELRQMDLDDPDVLIAYSDALQMKDYARQSQATA